VIQAVSEGAKPAAPTNETSTAATASGALNLMQFVRTSKQAANVEQPRSALASLREFSPSALTPRGNVGTPVAFVMNMIESCRLPPSAFKRLGLDLDSYRRANTKRMRVYTNVEVRHRLGYGSTVARWITPTRTSSDARPPRRRRSSRARPT